VEYGAAAVAEAALPTGECGGGAETVELEAEKPLPPPAGWQL